MLVDNQELLIKYGGVGRGLNFDTVETYILSVENDIIKPLISAELYDALNAFDQDNPPPDSKLPELLPLVQSEIVKLGLAESLDFIQVNISDLGVTRTEKSDSKSAYHYQKLEAQEAFRRAGFAAEDTLLKYLEANADHAEFSGWKTAEGYTLARQYMIKNADEFSAYYSINKSRRTFLALLPIITRVEDITIQEAIGEGLFSEIKAEITANAISEENNILLSRFIRPALAYLTIAESVNELALEVTPKGVILGQQLAANMNVDEKKAPPANRMETLSQTAESTGLLYLSKLRTFLIKEASAQKYAAFYNSDLYPKPKPETSPREEGTRRRRIYNGL